MAQTIIMMPTRPDSSLGHVGEATKSFCSRDHNEFEEGTDDDFSQDMDHSFEAKIQELEDWKKIRLKAIKDWKRKEKVKLMLLRLEVSVETVAGQPASCDSSNVELTKSFIERLTYTNNVYRSCALRLEKDTEEAKRSKKELCEMHCKTSSAVKSLKEKVQMEQERERSLSASLQQIREEEKELKLREELFERQRREDQIYRNALQNILSLLKERNGQKNDIWTDVVNLVKSRDPLNQIMESLDIFEDECDSEEEKEIKSVEGLVASNPPEEVSPNLEISRKLHCDKMRDQIDEIQGDAIEMSDVFCLTSRRQDKHSLSLKTLEMSAKGSTKIKRQSLLKSLPAGLFSPNLDSCGEVANNRKSLPPSLFSPSLDSTFGEREGVDSFNDVTETSDRQIKAKYAEEHRHKKSPDSVVTKVMCEPGRLTETIGQKPSSVCSQLDNLRLDCAGNEYCCRGDTNTTPDRLHSVDGCPVVDVIYVDQAETASEPNKKKRFGEYSTKSSTVACCSSYESEAPLEPEAFEEEGAEFEEFIFDEDVFEEVEVEEEDEESFPTSHAPRNQRYSDTGDYSLFLSDSSYSSWVSDGSFYSHDENGLYRSQGPNPIVNRDSYVPAMIW